MGRQPGHAITGQACTPASGEENYMNYCNAKFTKVLETVANTLSASAAGEDAQRAEAKYMVKDIPSIPIFARPVFVIHAASLKGPVVNPTTEG